MNLKRKRNKILAKTVEAEWAGSNKNGPRFDELFSKNWEVFVIKKDRVTEKLVGKTACCATACV